MAAHGCDALVVGLDAASSSSGSSGQSESSGRAGRDVEQLHVLCCCCCWLVMCRVNMRAIEVTIQNLIGSGMDPKTENNPYLGFIYTSFQERATKVR